MESFVFLVLMVGLLAVVFALLECSKLLHTVDRYKQSVDVLEDLYRGVRADYAETVDKLNKVLSHVHNIVGINDQILDHDRSVIEDVEKLKNDISMLQERLEDVNDNS